MNEKRYWFVFCRVCECVRAVHAYTFSISTSLRGVAPSLSVCLSACLRVCQRHAAPLGRQCPRSSDIGITSRFDLRRVFIVTCLLCLAPAGTVLCLPGKCLSVSYVVAAFVPVLLLFGLWYSFFFIFRTFMCGYCICSVCGGLWPVDILTSVLRPVASVC